MTTSILENIRQLHEDIEQSERVAAFLLNERSRHHRQYRPIYDHAIKDVLLKIQNASYRALELYVDKDGLRKREIDVIGGVKEFNSPMTDGNNAPAADENHTVWLNFYDQLKSIKTYYRTHPSASDDAAAAKEILKDTKQIANEFIEQCNIEHIFSPNENLGKRVDLMPFFLEFTNIHKIRKYREDEFTKSEIARIRKRLQTLRKLSGQELETQLQLELKEVKFQEMDYITYLKTIDDVIPRHCKYLNDEYEAYLTNLLTYLQTFLKRLNPLTNHDKLDKHLCADFGMLWDSRKLPSWDTLTRDMPYFCAVTNHLFSSEGLLKGHMEGKKYKTALKKFMTLSIVQQQDEMDKVTHYDRNLAFKEFAIQKYCEILKGIIEKTIESYQKKQSRTLRELELGDDSNEEDNDEDILVNLETKKPDHNSDAESDDGKPVYNPLNLPLGWDGKPIPFWLYKLHGLGIEYKCEICGNHSYWGRRAFERHFQEWRHAFGMRCLKIPNTVHFKEITKIEDAILLYEQLKKEAIAQRTDQEVECEDMEGNVMSARDYGDLRRQGLI